MAPDTTLAENTRASVLFEAESLVNGDRNASYGDPRQDFRRIADAWSDYLTSVNDEYVSVNPHDVAVMMMLMKMSRLVHSPQKRDSWVDIAGYAACGADCAEDTYGGLK